MRAAVLRTALLLGALVLGLPVGAASEREPDILPRTIYVPIRFEVGGCLDQVVIRNADGEIRGKAPGRVVAQFAFFDHMDGANPEWERLVVEGRIRERPEAGAAAGPRQATFRTEVVVTPTAIYYGRRRVDLEPESHLPRFRRRNDIRYPERSIRLRGGSGCDAEGAPLTPAEAGEPHGAVLRDGRGRR